MPGEQQPKSSPPPTLNAQTEKPIHYSYLKEFRVEACPLFKQHQCHQHRPYTCFNWHFANQRRRRPVRRRDGTFSYSPDIYCTKYDENTGVCPDGDECPFLHRVAGDVERKYHLRYYKTALCVHPTDSKGQCVKNGMHCAFAHSPEDLRSPIFDIREIQQSGEANGEILENKDRTSFVVEDQIWQDQEHVLACYKTEPCKKPPRLCRQGYACPFYHNSKDRRRPPGIHAYRSTPCPNAKLADEWADPEACDSGENCQYCHTRTEQQFHPEIYKSTRCNDMLQHGYCPRGPFCAFAHNEGELHAGREVKQPTECYANMIREGSMGQTGETGYKSCSQSSTNVIPTKIDIPEAPYPPDVGVGRSFTDAAPGSAPIPSLIAGSAPSYSSVLKQRSQSGGNKAGVAAGLLGTVSNRSFSHDTAPQTANMDMPTRIWPGEIGGDRQAASRLRTTSLTLNSHLDMVAGTPPTPGSLRSNSFSPFGGCGGWGTGGMVPSLHPAAKDLVHGGDSSISNMLEDLSLDEQQLHLTTIAEKEEIKAGGVTADGLRLLTTSADSSTSSGGKEIIGVGIYGTSAPVSIPGTADNSALSQGILASSGSDPHQFRMSGSFTQPVFPTEFNWNSGLSPTVLMTELQRTKEELASHRAKLTSWEEGLKQARQACEAWKREAEEHQRKALQVEVEKQQVTQERDAAIRQLQLIKSEMSRVQQNTTQYSSGPNALDLVLGGGMEQTYNRLRTELDRLEGQQLHHRLISGGGGGPMCGRCGRVVNGASGNAGCPMCSSNAKNGTLTAGTLA